MSKSPNSTSALSVIDVSHVVRAVHEFSAPSLHLHSKSFVVAQRKIHGQALTPPHRPHVQDDPEPAHFLLVNVLKMFKNLLLTFLEQRTLIILATQEFETVYE